MMEEDQQQPHPQPQLDQQRQHHNNQSQHHHKHAHAHSHAQQPLPSSSSSSSYSGSETEPESEHEELRHMVLTRPLINQRKRLSKQLSMCETPRDVAWEKRRRQILLSQERRRNGFDDSEASGSGSGAGVLPPESTLTDEDLRELKGCIDLGFGFNEENGQGLTNTLPALDLYFAVNRQFSPSPVSTPNGSSSSRRSSSVASPRSDSDSWKICSPGDDPQQVKTKLRHWAQAVACSVKQSY